jgi:hypothetical protein
VPGSCSVCRLPSDVRAEAEQMMERGVPLRTIEARVAEAGHTAKKDAIARHHKNGHKNDDEALEVRAIAMAFKRVLPSAPDVAAALAHEVEAEGAADLGRALRELVASPAA